MLLFIAAIMLCADFHVGAGMFLMLHAIYSAESESVMTSERATEIERLEKSWLCYHCNTTFTDGESASRHFGTATNDVPLCQADKMLIVIARKERDEYASIRAHLLTENMRLRTALQRISDLGPGYGEPTLAAMAQAALDRPADA